MMTIIRKVNGEEKKLLGGHFSAMMEKNKHQYLPCEGEAFAIKITVLHFQEFIKENPNTTVHHTDSMPCVQAWRRMTVGKFSSCPRISAFLTTMSSLPIRVEHRPGSSMQLADHASRHPPPPCGGKCEICQYVQEEQAVGDNIDAVMSIDEEGNVVFSQNPLPPVAYMEIPPTE